MTTLQQFLNQETVVSHNTNSLPDLEHGFLSVLSHLSLIRVTGIDAANFLHNQLTNDVEHLGHHEAKLAAYCSSKGRMLASVFFWKTEDDIFLQMSSTIQTSIQKRLQMFVLRAKVNIASASEEYISLGLGGKTIGKVLQYWFPHIPSDVHAKFDNEYGSVIRVADAFGYARYQWILKRSVLESIWPTLKDSLVFADASVWRRAEILAGIPHIIDKTQEQFVPQMVNFELIGGINFKKGCYPGQEIVARSQYLGKLKRRMSIAEIDSTEVQAGMEVFSDTDSSQPCGMIVNAELQSNQTSICLVELKVSDLDAGNVCFGSAKLKFLPLPYPILDVTQ